MIAPHTKFAYVWQEQAFLSKGGDANLFVFKDSDHRDVELRAKMYEVLYASYKEEEIEGCTDDELMALVRNMGIRVETFNAY